MSGWLIDTNVLSEVRRPKPDRGVVQFFIDRPQRSIFISVVTIAEIRFGLETLADPIKRADMANWLSRFVRATFEGRILAVNEDIWLQWRLLVASGRKARHTFSQPDLFLAATALHHNLTLVTRNVADFRLTGAVTLNPWG